MNHFPGTASLLQQVDKKTLVVLRDGRHLVGTMRSFDQFSNIILEDTVERHVVGNLYSDIELGLYIIRGENIVLLGDLDEEKEKEEAVLKKVSPEEIMVAGAEQRDKGDTEMQSFWNFETL